jgi:hypothetical protein
VPENNALVIDAGYLLKTYEEMRTEYGADRYGDILTTFQLDGRYSTLLHENRTAILLRVLENRAAVEVRVLDIDPGTDRTEDCIFPVEILIIE